MASQAYSACANQGTGIAPHNSAMAQLFSTPTQADFLSTLNSASSAVGAEDTSDSVLRFTADCPATPLAQPALAASNDQLLAAWGYEPPSDHALWANVLSGNVLWPNAGNSTSASVYSGHQFGVWAGQLGDGRALMLGQVDTAQGSMELQLKGAGPTPFSRRGDGRAVLRSSIREYLCSEAMHGLGIPTTRALALVASSTQVRRETIETTAVVTRAAASFLRFGHLEHFAHHGQHHALRVLFEALVSRYFPQLVELKGDELVAALLGEVSSRTAKLMAQWQSVGFCHGVMNTDNMSLLGLTLDYGPFQFLDVYEPTHICNHSDDGGRYAFNQQPQIGYWNLHALAQALVPLMSSSDAATEHLQGALKPYPDAFSAHYTQLLSAKLGLDERRDADADLINDWMSLLASQSVDHTLAWRNLSPAQHVQAPALDAEPPRALADLFKDTQALAHWWRAYTARLSHLRPDQQATWGQRMRATNPKYVLRNHLAQLAIDAAKQGNWQVMNDLKAVLDAPFDEHPAHQEWANLPPAWAAGLSLSCSS